MNEEQITISKTVYDKLVRDADKLWALERAGVDNWEGSGYAIDLLNESEEE